MARLIGVSGSIEQENEKVFLLRAYFSALESVGLTPVLLSLDTRGEKLTELVGRLDGVMLAGGMDFDPALYGQAPLPEMGGVTKLRDDFELALIREVVRQKTPTLGICRGIQAMNVALGGTLYQDIPTQVHAPVGHDHTTHEIRIDSASPLKNILGQETAQVNSYHHQAVLAVAPSLVSCAYALDGVIEAVYAPTLPFFLGVQWHPEKTYNSDEPSQAIFHAFADACGRV